MNVWFTTVMVPVRLAPVVLAVAWYDTVPLPVPLAPDVMVIQEGTGTAFQGHALPVVTENDPVPPELGTLALDGLSARVQTATPACVTVYVCPPTLMRPVRELVDGFGSAV